MRENTIKVKFNKEVMKNVIMKNKKPKIRLTKGQIKIFNYFNEVIKTDYFVKTISELRKKYKIPKNGFGIYKEEDGNNLIPRRWLQKTDSQTKERFFEDAKTICDRFKLKPNYYWYHTILSALFYKEPVFSFSLDLCEIWNLAWESEIVKKFPPAKIWLKNPDANRYPIAILISPYASERDILDFIRKRYATGIFPQQKKCKDSDIKIGRFKLKNQLIQLRNQFIYQHRHLPRKEIETLVRKKLGEILDYGHIGKIISLERKKRKEV